MEHTTENSEKMYEERIIFFIDTLGFKNIIENTLDKEGNSIQNKINEVVEMYDTLNIFLYKEKENNDKLYASEQISIFSDSIVISFKREEESAVFMYFHKVILALANLANDGFLFRGGVVVGKLYHDSQMVFGPGLVKAHYLESKVAKYPRIIVEQDVIDLGSENGHNEPGDEKNAILNMLKKDKDGRYYLDYMYHPLEDFEEYEDSIYLDNLKKHICKELNNGDEKVKEKYIWMKDEYNEVVDRLNSTGTKIEKI